MKKRGLKLLCLDIGNTSTSFGIYENGRFQRTGHILSSSVPLFVKKSLVNDSHNPSLNIIISCVVPPVLYKIMKLTARKGVRKRVLIIGKNYRLPLKHRYKNLKRLGSDRQVNAYGATRFYGAPLLILDYGTALTCDYVSSKGVFEGGLIIPGPEIALKALSEKAALLPTLGFPKKAGLFGRDTRSGMEAGILQGYGALTDGLVERFGKHFGRKFRVIATGGLARLIARYSCKIDRLDPLLTLKSLVAVFKDYAKTS